MPISKTISRATIWAALDAADATLSNAAYVITTAQIDAAQADIDALELKNDIIASKAANNTVVVKATGAMPATTKSIKVVDEAGATVGYAPLYATATLV